MELKKKKKERMAHYFLGNGVSCAESVIGTICDYCRPQFDDYDDGLYN